MNREKDFKSMLITALEMEENGYDFYKGQSAKSKNKTTKDMFSFLADNELAHIYDIKVFYNDTNAGKAPDELSLLSEKQNRMKHLDIFSKRIDELDEKISPDDNDKKACEFALGIEKDGYDYYKKMLGSTDDTHAIALLEFLLDEEKRHYEIIEKMYNYLTDSANWFMYEEGSFPQG
jgi:rubrerythrin